MNFVWVMTLKMYLGFLLKAVIWKSHLHFQFTCLGDFIPILGRSYPLKPNKTVALEWKLDVSSTSDHLLLVGFFLRLLIAWVAINKQLGFFLQTALFFICGHHFSTETFIRCKMELWLWGWCRQNLDLNSWGMVGREAFKIAASLSTAPSLQVGVVTERVTYKYVLQRWKPEWDCGDIFQKAQSTRTRFL